MSIKEISSIAGDVPNKITHNMGLSIMTRSLDSRGESAFIIAPNTTKTTRSVQADRAIERSTTVHVPLVTQSTPHRAWEAGYKSPFAQGAHQFLDQLGSNVQTKKIYYPTGSASQLSLEAQNELPSVPKEDVFVRGAINPRVDLRSTTPVSITTSIPAHPKPATPQRTISYRQRMRKIATNEITLDDIDAAAMAKLGLSLFMVDQDMIANQNRFVRNECAFAHHILRLQRTTSDADAHHTQIERDIYKHLEHHKSTLDALARMCGPTTSPSSLTAPHSARHDPDFLELEKSHQETRAILEALSMQVSESSQSTQRALMDLVKRLDQIVRTGATYPNAITRSPTAITPLSPLISSSSTSRTWGSSRDSILESPRTIPPPTPEFPNHPWHRPQ